MRTQDDVRSRRPAFQQDQARELDKLDKIKSVLTQDGRTLAQAALGWLWVKSSRTIPIPGLKTIAQTKENVGALRFGPLTDEQMNQITALLA